MSRPLARPPARSLARPLARPLGRRALGAALPRAAAHATRSVRRGAWLAGLLGVLLGGLLGVGPCATPTAQAGEGVALHASLPAHTLPRLDGYPPYAPDPLHVESPAARAAWAEAAEACAGRTAADVQRGALYASAAEAWRSLLRVPLPAAARAARASSAAPDVPVVPVAPVAAGAVAAGAVAAEAVARAEACLRAALAALDDAHPLDALVRLSLLDLALGEHLAPDALALGARAWLFLERPAPRPGDPQAALDAWARERIRTLAPPALLQHAALEGDLPTACMWAESMAAEPQPAWGAPARLHEQAALLCYRAGRTPAAQRHAAEGQRLAGDDETQARLAFWQLHLAHGLLSPTGLLRPGSAVPGPGFAREVAALHAALAGNTQAGSYLLCSASCALQAGALAQALAIYRLALDDPHLVQAAWRHAGLWGGLLPAVRVAQALGQPDLADELLARIEALAGEPVPEAEALRAHGARARQRAAHPPGPASGPDTAPPGLPRAGTGRLEVASRSGSPTALAEATRAGAALAQAAPERPPGPDEAAARARTAQWLGGALVLAGLLLGAAAAWGCWRAQRAAGTARPARAPGARPARLWPWGRDAR
ncbi:MAG: hypothetical protein ACKOSS_07485 [Planctomycetia bacterium]